MWHLWEEIKTLNFICIVTSKASHKYRCIILSVRRNVTRSLTWKAVSEWHHFLRIMGNWQPRDWESEKNNFFFYFFLRQKLMMPFAQAKDTGTELFFVMGLHEVDLYFVCSMSWVGSNSWQLSEWVMSPISCLLQPCSAPVDPCLQLILWSQSISSLVFLFSCCLVFFLALWSSPKNTAFS